MKPAAACLLVAFAATVVPALAQGAGDPVDKPGQSRAASSSGNPVTPESWIFSETASPVDYSPVVIASATAGGASDGSGLKLSIACRGGNTSLALTAPGILPAGERYTVSYAVDGGAPTMLPAAAAPFGTGVAVVTDVVRLLVSLPARGEIAFRIVGRPGTWEGRYSLAGLTTTRERMAASCKWPVRPDTARK